MAVVFVSVPLGSGADFVERFEDGTIPATYIDLSPEAKPPREVGAFDHRWTIKSDDLGKIDLGDGGVRLDYKNTYAYLAIEDFSMPRENYTLVWDVKDISVRDLGENNGLGRWNGELNLSRPGGIWIGIHEGGDREIGTTVRLSVPLKGWGGSTRWYNEWIRCGEAKKDIRVEVHVRQVEGERPTGNEYDVVVVADGEVFGRDPNGTSGGDFGNGGLEIQAVRLAATVTHLELRSTADPALQRQALLGLGPASYLDSNGDRVLDAADLVRAE